MRATPQSFATNYNAFTKCLLCTFPFHMVHDLHLRFVLCLLHFIRISNRLLPYISFLHVQMFIYLLLMVKLYFLLGVWIHAMAFQFALRRILNDEIRVKSILLFYYCFFCLISVTQHTSIPFYSSNFAFSLSRTCIFRSLLVPFWQVSSIYLLDCVNLFQLFRMFLCMCACVGA